jgi:hypothetical protein
MSDLLNYTDDSYYPYVVLPPQAYNLLQQPPLPALELPKEPRKPVRPQPPDKPPLNRSLAIGLLCFLIRLIDVEVDEPWFFQNGERIAYHCLDDSRQLKRDCYFQQAGWIVIRFAEQQVSEDANLCAQFVVAVARHLLRSRRCTLPQMPCQKRWDRTSALQHSRP